MKKREMFLLKFSREFKKKPMPKTHLMTFHNDQNHLLHKLASYFSLENLARYKKKL